MAWRRTTLSLVVVSLVIVRSSLSSATAVPVMLSAVVLIVAVWLAVSALRRGRWSATHANEPEFRLLGDGRLPALLTVLAVMMCALVAAVAWS